MKVLEIDGVSVRYPVERVPSLKEWVIRSATSPRRKAYFNALDSVSLTLAQGEALGVIGPNGAGKSTLLRLAAGIISPSIGHTVTWGSVAPIIELGSGFEAELSGRENIYFNGALLGRSRAMLRERLDEIIDFSGLGAFIDAPLRTYSTGMVGRLAFAIATAVEADMILLDEILSVGDASFRARCEERIHGFYHRGSAVVLVSHDLESIEELCKTAIWLDRGRIRAHGAAREVIAAYTSSLSASPDRIE